MVRGYAQEILGLEATNYSVGVCPLQACVQVLAFLFSNYTILSFLNTAQFQNELNGFSAFLYYLNIEIISPYNYFGEISIKSFPTSWVPELVKLTRSTL